MSSNCSKRILLISYYFHPEPAVGARRPTEFAKSLEAEGFSVDILTVKRAVKRTPEYVNSLYEVREMPDPINIIWAGIKKIKKLLVSQGSQYIDLKKTANQMTCEEREVRAETKETLSNKAKRYVLSFQALISAQKMWVVSCVFQIVWLKMTGKKYDIILSSSPPSSVNLIAGVARYIFGAKWICDLRDPIIHWEDLYPECVSGLRVVVEEFLERKYLQLSDAILVTTPSFFREVEGKLALHGCGKEKVQVLYNGYDNQFECLGNSSALTDSFRIVHAGTLYMNRDPIPFFNSIKKIVESADIPREKLVVEFYGDCRVWAGVDLFEWLKNEGLDDVILLKGIVSSDELPGIYKSSQILLAFAQGQPKQIPAKIFEYIPYAGDILTVTEDDSDTAVLLKEFNLGVSVNNQVDSIKKALNEIFKNRYSSENKNKSEFSRGKQNSKLIELCRD